MLIPASVVDGKRVLDIGCNSGDVSIALAQVFSPIEVVGVDLDLSLIAKARKNLANKASVVGSDENEFGESTVLEKDYFPITSYLMFGPAPIIYDGDSDTKLSGDPMSKRSGNHAGNFFPQNVSFRASNFLTDPLLMTEKDKFDTILALSITKWIHVNHGDSGIKLFFQKCWNALRKGGVLILEPQSWEGDGYSRAFSKTGGSGSQGKALSSAMKDKKTGMRNLTLELHPDEFPTYLLDVVGFSDCEKLGETWNAARGFRREEGPHRQPLAFDPDQQDSADASADIATADGDASVLRCEVCAKPALFVCSLCDTPAPRLPHASAAHYCSEACQRVHWPVHRLAHAPVPAPAAVEPSPASAHEVPRHFLHAASTSPLTSTIQRSSQPRRSFFCLLRLPKVTFTAPRSAEDLFNDDTMDDLKYYLSQIYKILKPVIACIFFAILWVKLLNPPSQYWSGAHFTAAPDIYALNNGGSNSNNSISSNTVVNPNGESANQQQDDLFMALKTLGSVIGATFVIFILFYFNLMKILYAIFGIIIVGVLGLFGYYIGDTLLWITYSPLDYITFFFFLWNFSVVGIVAIFWKGPLWLQQVYLVLMSSMMASPYFLSYNASPTTLMATPANPNRSEFRHRTDDTELQAISKTDSITSSNLNRPPSAAQTAQEKIRRSVVPSEPLEIQGQETELDEEDEEDDRSGMKLGLGDFVFYSVLASRA
ncbi:hypothetical protein HDU82_004034, partial [Entophlyctis luteolus]